MKDASEIEAFAKRHGFDPEAVRREMNNMAEEYDRRRLFPEEVEMYRQLDDITYNASF